MQTLTPEPTPIRVEGDVVRVRQLVRTWTQQIGFSLVDQTKMVTAASELARNTLIHGGGGALTAVFLEEGLKKGLCLTFADEGPGIPDLDRALSDGFTTRGGLGLGLGGAKRLVNDFELHSTVGQGTSVRIVRWTR